MDSILKYLGDFIITIINYLLNGINIVLGWIINLFPDSPFSQPLQIPEGVQLGWIAWFFPFKAALIHASLLATAILTYYAYRVLARWIKLAKG